MKRLIFASAILIFCIPSTQATVINTGILNNTTTAGTLMNATSTITPSSTIRFEVGGAKFTGAATPLTLSVTVDASTPTVVTGSAADQAFKDDAVGAAFFGYYLTTGVRSANQPAAAAGVVIQVKKGVGETANRTYYLLGNGTTTPTVQGSLTIAPAVSTTFASTTKNAIRCGPSYVANGLSGTAMNCAAGTTVANMDITQFVKILYADAPSVAIVSQLQFIALSQ